MFSQTKPFAANEKCKRRLVQGQVNMFGWVEETNRVPKFVLCYPCCMLSYVVIEENNIFPCAKCSALFDETTIDRLNLLD